MFRNLKNSFERMKKGYCYSDLLDYNSFMRDMLIRSLTESLQVRISYPAQFNSFEDFAKHMKHFIHLLERLQKYYDEIFMIYDNELEESENLSAKEWKIRGRKFQKRLWYIRDQEEKIMKELKESDFLELILSNWS